MGIENGYWAPGEEGGKGGWRLLYLPTCRRTGGSAAMQNSSTLRGKTWDVGEESNLSGNVPAAGYQ